MIEWTSTDGEFTLEFTNGNPFVNTNGTYSISTKGTVFTCVIRNENPANPLEPVYKYNVVFGENCSLDPVVMLTR